MGQDRGRHEWMQGTGYASVVVALAELLEAWLDVSKDMDRSSQ